MTRQKKEILKRIAFFDEMIHIDMLIEPSSHDPKYKEIERLYEELAHLSHFSNADEMFYREMEKAGKAMGF